MCHADLRLVDVDTGVSLTLEDNRLTISGNSIAFSSQLLTTNKRYMMTIFESEIEIASEIISKDSTKYFCHNFFTYYVVC